MATPEPPRPGETDVIELSARQIQTLRGALNVAEDYAAHFRADAIPDVYDPVRAPHFEAVNAMLAKSLEGLAPGGTWRGRLVPTEAQATRDAVGLVEHMLTTPGDERLDALGYAPTDDELTQLRDARTEIPAPPPKDLAASDVRAEINTTPLRERTPYSEWLTELQTVDEQVNLGGLNVSERADPMPHAEVSGKSSRIARNAKEVTRCKDVWNPIVDMASFSITLANQPADQREPIIRKFTDALEYLLHYADGVCFDAVDRHRIRFAWAHTAERIERGSPRAGDYALGVVEMAAWADYRRRFDFIGSG